MTLKDVAAAPSCRKRTILLESAKEVLQRWRRSYVEDVLKILNANVGGVFLLELTNDIGKQIRHA